LFLPHSPYYYDSTGNFANQRDWYSIHGYLQQIRYSNVLIRQLGEIVNKPRKRPLVVVVEGDHGYRGETPIQTERETKFMNLNMLYFSDKDYRLLYDSLSPVNTFRIVLNKYFKQQLPMLSDTTVWLFVTL
jgi:hypothetical protein